MSKETKLDAAFDKWLSERRQDLTLRQQFWTAFKAGADYVLSEVRGELGKPASQESE